MSYSHTPIQSPLSIGAGLSTETLTPENALQRPPYLAAYGNDFIQSLIQSAQNNNDGEEIDSNLNDLIRTASDHQILQALPLVRPLGLAPIFDDRQWGIAEFIKILPQLPEQFILKLDALSTPFLGPSFEQGLDRFFPLGQGYSIEGFLAADIDTLHIGDAGSMNMMRTAPRNIHVESSREALLGVVGRAGGESNLFGRDWETEVEGQAGIAGSIQEIYDFPIHNPLLLLPLMATHGALKVDVIQELFSIVAPDGYKEYRQSVTYGVESQLDAMAAYKAEQPQLHDLALAFGLAGTAGFEISLSKATPDGVQSFELSCFAGCDASAEVTFLIRKLGLPQQVIDEGLEAGAKIQGHWTPKEGTDTLAIDQFSLLASRNPELSRTCQQQSGLSLALEWDDPTQLDGTTASDPWPNRLRIELQRGFNAGLRTAHMAPTLMSSFEQMGIDLNSQVSFHLCLVIPQSTLIQMWTQVRNLCGHPSEFIVKLCNELRASSKGDLLSRIHPIDLVQGSWLEAATVRISHQAQSSAELKAGLLSGIGMESALAIGSYQEIDLCNTECESPLQQLFLGDRGALS